MPKSQGLLGVCLDIGHYHFHYHFPERRYDFKMDLTFVLGQRKYLVEKALNGKHGFCKVGLVI